MRGLPQYTYTPFLTGPFVKRALKGRGKRKTERADLKHFFYINPKLYEAIVSPSQMDLSVYPLDSIVYMMDGAIAKNVLVSDYLSIRVSCENQNIRAILQLIDANKDRPLIMAYGFYAISTIPVPHDSNGNMTIDAKNAMDLCFDTIIDRQKEYSLTTKAFALHTLYNILSDPAGRYDFFDISEDVNDLPMEGPMGKRIIFRLKTLNR
jgi:hypothetical protein